MGFSPREERIARIHHYGQMDQVSPHLRVRYPIQQALGITPSDSEVLTSAIYSHLARE
ncbi:phage virion morphogenesis protein [Zoogloea sp.]|uniref:phage virion morphogenesis protein n=1 Tax=Zoogloea sp. TaxID=49181 RepID=UPI0035B48FA8